MDNSPRSQPGLEAASRGRLPAAVRTQFDERGYVVVPDLIPLPELEAFGQAVDAAVAKRRRGDTRTLAEKSRYEQSFQQCINLWEDSPAVRPLVFHPAVAEAACALLGVAAVRLWHDQALYKEAGGRETDAHQDQPYWPLAEPLTVTAWIPFDDVELEDGAMGYVPGSHRFGVRRFANIFTGRGFDLEAGDEARGVRPEFARVPRGSVAFHHGLTIHLAKPNSGPRPRRVQTMIYFADGCTRGAEPAGHPCVDRAGIAIGEPVASAVTPIAWPRPGNDLPLPPGSATERETA